MPVHTSYVAGIVSMDQRLVSFQLRPGAEDPGPGNWKAASWIPPGTRTGLLATFNGGFKLDSAGGGFYLNGASKGALVNGAASVVYYRNGTVKIGAWGSDVRMTPNVVGVRQNLKLLIDHGKIPASVNSDVLGAWGATLGGGYYVWRSGIGITEGGRVIFVYGPALNAQDLANLLKRAGAVEAMQLDINPEWMSYDYYKASGHPADPSPQALLPTQQGSPYRYYSILQPRFHGSLRTVTAQTSATDTKVAARPRHARRPSWPVAVLRTARPRQWPKNLLVFAAPLAGLGLGRRDWLLYAFVAAAAFGCASIAVYFINDVADAERDRSHPRKRHRPVAAGDLPKRHAVVLGAVAAAAGLAGGVLISEPLLTACVGGYLALSFLYSWVLKHIPVVEVLFVASGFLLRVLGGAAATHVPPSGWFLLVCSLGAFGVAIAKRYTELTNLGPEAIRHRPVMRFYRPAALRYSQIIVGALMIAAYLAWAAGEHPSARPWHLASAVPLAAALVRFGFLTGRRTSAPVEDLLMRDVPMLVCEAELAGACSWRALAGGTQETGE